MRTFEQGWKESSGVYLSDPTLPEAREIERGLQRVTNNYFPVTAPLVGHWRGDYRWFVVVKLPGAWRTLGVILDDAEYAKLGHDPFAAGRTYLPQDAREALSAAMSDARPARWPEGAAALVSLDVPEAHLPLAYRLWLAGRPEQRSAQPYWSMSPQLEGGLRAPSPLTRFAVGAAERRSLAELAAQLDGIEAKHAFDADNANLIAALRGEVGRLKERLDAAVAQSERQRDEFVRLRSERAASAPHPDLGSVRADVDELRKLVTAAPGDLDRRLQAWEMKAVAPVSELECRLRELEHRPTPRPPRGGVAMVAGVGCISLAVAAWSAYQQRQGVTNTALDERLARYVAVNDLSAEVRDSGVLSNLVTVETMRSGELARLGVPIHEGDTITTLTDALTELRQVRLDPEDLKTEPRKLHDVIRALSSDVATLEEETASWTAIVEGLQAQIASLQTSVSSLPQSIVRFDGATQPLAAWLATTERVLWGSGDPADPQRVPGVVNKLNGIDPREFPGLVASLTAELRAARGHGQALEGHIAELQNRLTRLESHGHAGLDQIATITSRIKALEERRR